MAPGWLVVLALLLTPAALATPALDVAPGELALGSGETRGVVVTLAGVDERGGVYDLFVAAGGLRVEMERAERTQGILLLPGQPIDVRWEASVATRDDVDGRQNVTFRLIERPSHTPPRTYETVLAVRGASVDDEPGVSIFGAPARAAGDNGDQTARGPAAAVVVGVGSTVAAAIALAALARRRWWLLAALYSRLPRERILDHPVRRAMTEAIRARPGIPRAVLQRALALADGQVDHHLRRLVQTGIVVKVERGGQRLLYLAGTDAPADADLAADVAAALAARTAATAREVASMVGLSPQHARYYLEKLRRSGAATAESRGRRVVYRSPPA